MSHRESLPELNQRDHSFYADSFSRGQRHFLLLKFCRSRGFYPLLWKLRGKRKLFAPKTCEPQREPAGAQPARPQLLCWVFFPGAKAFSVAEILSKSRFLPSFVEIAGKKKTFRSKNWRATEKACRSSISETTVSMLGLLSGSKGIFCG